MEIFIFCLFTIFYPPICTVGKPPTITPPCAVKSPCRAAGRPPIKTVVEPLTITSGGPAHTHKSPTTAAGKLPIKTVGTDGPLTGPPTCGFGVAKGHVCISVIRAADGIIFRLEITND
jgi:hypothetical protein